MLIEIILIVFVLSGLIGMALDVFQPLPEVAPLNCTWTCPRCECKNDDDLSQSTFTCEGCHGKFGWEEISWSDVGVGAL